MVDEQKIRGILTELAAARRLVKELNDHRAKLPPARTLDEDAPLVDYELDQYNAISGTLFELGVHASDDEIGIEPGDQHLTILRAGASIPVADVGFALELMASRKVIVSLMGIGFDPRESPEFEEAIAAYDSLIADLEKLNARYVSEPVSA